MTWYDGGENLPKEKRVTKEMLDGMEPAGSGLLLIGEKGSFYSKNDYGAEHTLLPKDKFKDVKEPEADPAPGQPRALQGVGRRDQGQRAQEGALQLRLRRPIDRDRGAGRGRAEGRLEDRVGRRRHEGQEQLRRRPVHPPRLPQGVRHQVNQARDRGWIEPGPRGNSRPIGTSFRPMDGFS